jgi:hypothetical protein
MRALDDTPIDPEVQAELDAIDATLAGERVDSKYAEVAELALLLTSDRPVPREEFLQSLDARIERRFASAGGGATRGGRRWRAPWGMSPVWGSAAVGLAAAVAAVVVLSSGGGGGGVVPRALNGALERPAQSERFGPITAGHTGSSSARSSAAGSAAGLPSVPATTPSNGPAKAAPLARTSSPKLQNYNPAPTYSAPTASPKSSAGSSSRGSSAGSAAPSAGNGALAVPQQGAQSLAAAPTPPPNGRKIVQSAQLALGAPADRIEAVAQEVFDVVGNQHGIVEHSSVTANGGPGAYAEFQLSIPSANLSQALSELSKMQYAHVTSRTDSSQDVNRQFVDERGQLREAQALRTSLLKQLAAAVTTEQVDSIRARLHDVDARIGSIKSALDALNHRVAFSRLDVTINAGSAPVPAHHSPNHGFTLGRAVHDAGRVLTVVAGVVLITLAAMVPIGLVMGLAISIGAPIRRRRREHALDLA